MSIKSVYLGGRIDGISYKEATETRDIIVKQLNAFGITCYNPMRGKDDMKDCVIIDKQHTKFEMQEIVSRDLFEIQKADALVIVSGDVPTWGTAMEAGFVIGKYGIYQKPIFIYNKNSTDRFGWAYFLATKVFNDINEMIAYIINF